MVPADFSDWRNIELQNRKRRRCCSVRCLKAPMHMFTFFYWLSGVALVVVGAWTLLFESRYNVLLGSSWFLIIVGLMIGTGGLIMIVCICGCYGIVKEHRYSLISFLILLTLIFIIECSIGVAAFVHRSYIEENLDKSALDRMNEYGTSDAVRSSFDDLQQRHMCCGSSSYSTWNNTAWKQMTENQNLSVPDSCCKTITPACGKRDHPSNIYHEGCILKLSEFFREHVFILGFIALVLSAVQLTGIILSSCMIRLVEY
ncbi:CD151 antigen-like [Pocillopora damicornis]|uniref:CD151 antigen-like n=1 Tax=Pocillopora damicornis TaxID=46731 RepID=UPI000F54E523|nr:CD151 antigen-like [Pocillopora damicornis]